MVTASTEIQNDTEVEIVLNFIEANKIPVFIFTYSLLDNTVLSQLVSYGNLFTGKSKENIPKFEDLFQ